MSKLVIYVVIASSLAAFSLLSFIVFGMNIKKEVSYKNTSPGCHSLELDKQGELNLKYRDVNSCGNVKYGYGFPLKYAEVNADSYHEMAPAISINTANIYFIVDALIWALLLPAVFTILIVAKDKRKK